MGLAKESFVSKTLQAEILCLAELSLRTTWWSTYGCPQEGKWVKYVHMQVLENLKGTVLLGTNFL